MIPDVAFAAVSSDGKIGEDVFGGRIIAKNIAVLEDDVSDWNVGGVVVNNQKDCDPRCLQRYERMAQVWWLFPCDAHVLWMN